MRVNRIKINNYQAAKLDERKITFICDINLRYVLHFQSEKDAKDAYLNGWADFEIGECGLIGILEM